MNSVKEVAEAVAASEEEAEEIIEEEAEDSDQTQLSSKKTVTLRHSGHLHPRISSSITRSPTRKEETDDKEAKTARSVHREAREEVEEAMKEVEALRCEVKHILIKLPTTKQLRVSSQLMRKMP